MLNAQLNCFAITVSLATTTRMPYKEISQILPYDDCDQQVLQ